jgi:glycosyltransferase involved in cell wall biosynthesis
VLTSNILNSKRDLVSEANLIFREKYFDLDTLLSSIYNLVRQKRNSIEDIQENKIRSKFYSTGKSIYGFAHSSPFINTFLFENIGWYKYGLMRGRKIIDYYQPKIIFSSHSPPVSHIIASKLSSEYAIPWVADFRDGWSTNHGISNRFSPLQYGLKIFETRILKNCTHITTVSGPIAERLRSLHKKNVTVITNGYDPEDYQSPVQLTNKFTITYTGRINPANQDITPLFKAVKLLSLNGSITEQNFEIRFYGTDRNYIDGLAVRFGITTFIKIYDPILFNICALRQKESRVLLLLGWDAPQDLGVLTGKVFEYLGANRPILLISPSKDYVLDKLVHLSGNGTVVNDTLEVVNIINQWAKEISQGGDISTNYQGNNLINKQYSRIEQASQLAALFDDIITVSQT